MRGGDDKDRDLENLRTDLVKYEVPGLSEPERKALIKSRKGTGTIRLAVPPENLVFDASLAELQFVGPGTTTKRSGQRGKVTQDHEDGLQNAATLLRDCRRLGAPGDPEAVKTPTKRRGSTRG